MFAEPTDAQEQDAFEAILDAVMGDDADVTVAPSEEAERRAYEVILNAVMGGEAVAVAAACDCCGNAKPTPNSYGCLPHVVFDALCDECADEIEADLKRDGELVPKNDPHWYFKRPALTLVKEADGDA